LRSLKENLMAQADIIALSTTPDGETPWGNKMRGAMATLNEQSFGVPVSGEPVFMQSVQSMGTASRGVFHRVRAGGFVSSVAVAVGTSSGNVAVAVYANSGSGRSAVPSTRVATSGSVACPAPGFALISLGATVTVEPGDWLYLWCDNTTATFRCASSGIYATNPIYAGFSAYEDGAVPAPATATPIAGLIRGFLLVGVP
jgi:hypothetical protein